MKKWKCHVTGMLVVLAGIEAAVPVTAHAYLDPGTGSLILQGILGTVAAVAVTGRIYWHRLKRFFGLKKEEPAEESDSNAGETLRNTHDKEQS